ncbi:hypothetical protein SARC_05981 [Sphaeroforma arctica JP610]|uniref:Glucose-methanol-choline oxidoreductase N-terminal domain-containing protein n=1 Tax=Sphaeroforma arctica JP610 TaxID=667725 RepID=A0A0L0FYK9_9EUKA|nr:hypothetical protein SARC_05981 [Sphaeroforma arctica JP610]KNC81709.1 hypothetical protein SARC_05981 [Sphaeroforma arctica JP610]|eukprot:XP_014155611.1 hypothetical protein SARC_05981 [Sphaeroforma arctica JP610]
MAKSLRSLAGNSKHVYDYVIVGGGSAGCLMANRLSSDPSVRVALLETGPDDNTPIVQQAVGYFWAVPYSRKYNHRFYSKPEKHCNNRVLLQPRGRVLGGSSSINAMLYIRGSKHDYDDRWVKEAGCKGWDYETMLNAFKLHENNDTLHDEYHGTSGPLQVRTMECKYPIDSAMIQGSIDLGLKENHDFNGAEQDGVGRYQSTQRSGNRCSAARAFLPPEVRNRPNLDVIVDAHVTRVTTEGKKATGVQAVVSRSKNADNAVTFESANDVILCGGAFNSPQLLLLSGIGPKEEVTKHGIELVHELPGVGQNMQDHPDVGVNAKSKHNVSHPLQIGASGLSLQANHAKMMGEGKGCYSGEFGIAGAFFKTMEGSKAADVQQHLCPFYYKNHGAIMTYGSGLTIKNCVLRGQSRGSVTLDSSDPMAPPALEMGFFKDDYDMEVMITGIRASLNLLKTQGCVDQGLTLCGFKDPNNIGDDEIREYIRNNVDTVYHPVSTCAMGPDSNPMSVVGYNNGLKVHGMEGLRVIDASTMPLIISGNTNAPTMALAQVAYDQMVACKDVKNTDSSIVSCQVKADERLTVSA